MFCAYNYDFKIIFGAEVMSQWVRSLASLPENHGSIPRTHKATDNYL